MKHRQHSKRPSSSRPLIWGFSAGILLGLLVVFLLGLGRGDSQTSAVTMSRVSSQPTLSELAALLGTGLSSGGLSPTGALPSELSLDSLGPDPFAAKNLRPLRLVAVGDILLARGVGRNASKNGWADPFRASQSLISSADIAFANLECPASYLGEPYPGKDSEVTFRAEPGSLLGIKYAGFDVLSLANNHMNDFGQEALIETLDALDTLGIARSGAGRNRAEAHKAAILSHEGKKLAFLAYAEHMWSVIEAGDRAGVAIVEEKAMAADIAAARENADIVLVSIHWGEEHEGLPRERDRALARRLIDAGANGIIGHHPHVLQGAEFYKGAPILYSLGNFAFDMLSYKTYETAAAILTIGDEGISLRYIPLRISRKSYGPAPATGNDAYRIAALIRERCALLGTETKLLSDASVLVMP